MNLEDLYIGKPVKWDSVTSGHITGNIIGICTSEAFKGVIKVEVTSCSKTHRLKGEKLHVKIASLID